MAKLTDLDMMQRGRRYLIGAVMIVIGGVVGYAFPRSSVQPTAQSGTVTSVTAGSGGAPMSFEFTPHVGRAHVFQLADPTPWQSPSGAWHQTGQPSCMVPGSTKPAAATLGLVTIDKSGSAPGGTLVAWVECDR